jgi:hypothetical protein
MQPLKKCLLNSWIKLLLMFFLPFYFNNSNAQSDSTINVENKRLKNIFSVGLGVQHGFIFAHSVQVQNTKGSRPTGVEGILSWQRNDAAVWDLCNCYPRKGLLLAYYDFDNSSLGKSYTAAYFLEPTYKISKKVFFSFRVVAGISWLTNPYDSFKNPTNQSYATYLNNYLLVGIGAWYRMSDKWWLNASVNYQHESNGGVKEPNRGVNWPTAGLTLSYQKNSRPYINRSRSREKFRAEDAPRFDLSIFGTLTRSLDAQGSSTQWPLLGVSLQAAKQVGRISGLNAGAEIYRDESLDRKLKRFSVDASPVKAGILLGHEFILGRFLFSQRVGVNVFDQTPYYDRIYHRWGILWRINSHLGTGIYLQAHRFDADFLDLRLTYSMQKGSTRSEKRLTH